MPESWTVAARLVEAGLLGARILSVRSRGANLVLWRWNGPEGARVEALDPPGDLPLTQTSWG